MPTLLYSPGLKVVIKSRKEGLVDISDDIVAGNVGLREDGEGHSFSFQLANHKRKYDRVFTPNDRVSIKMKRIRWVQVMSGYLDSVPYFSVYPRNVALSGSCTLKVLRNYLWDPHSIAAVNLLTMNADLQAKPGDIDDGNLLKNREVLSKVVGWQKRRIHIARLPMDWLDRVETLGRKISRQTQADASILNSGGMYGGGNKTAMGGTTARGNGPGTGTLPDLSGKISHFGGAGGGAYGNMALTGESGVNPRDGMYLAMRFPYTHLSGSQLARAKSWWRDRKILIYCPRTDRAVIGRAADWGPAEKTGRIIDVAPNLMSLLRAKTDDNVQVRFADPTKPLGLAKRSDTRASDRDNPELMKTGGSSGGSNAGTNTASKNDSTADVRDNPELLKGTSSAIASGKGRLSLDPINASNVGKGDINIWNAVAQVIATLPHDYVVISWQRVNSTVAGTSSISFHDSRRGGAALDIRPKNYKMTGGTLCGKPSLSENDRRKMDVLVAALRNAGFATVIWRTCAGGGHWDHTHVDNRGEAMKVGKNFFPGMGAGSSSGAATSGLVESWVEARTQLRASDEGVFLYGARALLNDTPVMPTVAAMMTASMRTFASAPNGDFIGWFPDYFGQYGTAGKMKVRDIELAGDAFTIQWSDRGLVTHQFTMGSVLPSVMEYGEGIELVRKYMTQGIASVEFPEIMEALFNVDITPKKKNRKRHRKANEELYQMFDAKAVLQRFGARNDFQTLPMLHGSAAEFWSALWWFQRSWASQFTAKVSLTFMPELFPGMLIVLPSFKFQAYVKAVNHSFSYQDGGEGFTTEATIIAPATTQKGGSLWGLPIGGS